MPYTPEIALIPSGYKASNLYAILPKSSPPESLTVTRASTAYRRDNDGLISVVSNNVPRLDYMRARGHVYKNLLNNSYFKHGQRGWSNYTAAGSYYVDRGFEDHEGGFNAWRIESDSQAAVISFNKTVSSATDYTLSIWAKGETGLEEINLSLRNSGSVGDGGNSYPSDYTTLTTEWKRYSVTITSTGTDRGFQVRLMNAFRGTGTAFIAFAQLEESSSLTDYELRNDIRDEFTTTESSDCPCYLIESAATNIEPYSSVISTSNVYTPSNSTLTENFTISPDGLKNASKLTTNSVNNTHRVYKSVTITGGNIFTWSVFVKKIDNNKVIVRMTPNVVSNNCEIVFNLNTKTPEYLKTGTIHSYGVDDYGDGWQRLWMAIDTDATDTAIQLDFQLLEDNATNVFEGTEKSVLLWGWQIEEGEHPTSYIETSGSTATRAAETANSLGSSDMFNSEEGTFIVECSPLNLTGSKSFAISDGTVSNRVALYYSNNAAVGLFVAGGVTQSQITKSNVNEAPLKMAYGYKNDDCAFYVDGEQIGTNSSATAIASGVIDRLNLDVGQGSNDFYGRVYSIMIFNIRLTNSEIKELTE